jgi:hypothetical protein
MKKREIAYLSFLLCLSFVLITCGGNDGGGGSSSGSFSSKVWGTAAPVTNLDGSQVPQIAMDSSGNAVVVWYQQGQADVHAMRYVAGTGWGTSTPIETNSGNQPFPQIAMDSNGNTMAVWRYFTGTFFEIWARYMQGGAWGPATRLEQHGVPYGGDTSGYSSPQVAMDSSGNAMVVWVYQENTWDHIFARRYVAGQGWGQSWLIETYGGTPHGNASKPKIAMDSSGNAMVVWSHYHNNRSNVWARRYVAGQDYWTAAEQITSSDADYPQVAMDASGNAIAVWFQVFEIYAKRNVPGTGWSTATRIDTAGGAFYPQVAMDGSGNAIAVWHEEVWGNPDQKNIWANRYAAGTGWGTAVALMRTSTGALNPQIAMDPSGNAMVVWTHDDGNQEYIRACRYVAGSGWGAVEPLDTGAVFAETPQIAMDSSGNAIAVWSKYDGSHRYIWANRFQ